MTVPEYNQSVHDYADRLYRFVLKNIRDTDAAKDIVQDCYEKLWLRYSEVNSAKVRSYLFTAAYHTLIDFTRKRKPTVDVEHLEKTGEDLQFGSPDLKKILDWALEQIPEIQKAVILLRDYEGYNYDEIGDITGLSESQVKVYIYRGRIALRKLIGSPEVLI